MAINLTGLLSGFQEADVFARQQKTADLAERRLRGSELDAKFKEARRIAELDAADEEETLAALQTPGLPEQTRNAILANRKRNRGQNESYLTSLGGDTDVNKELTKRFGDITKLLSPSAINAGTLPLPSMNLPQLITEADNYKKRIELMDPKSKAALVREGQDRLRLLGGSEQVIQGLLPDFQKKVGQKTIAGKRGELMDVAEPQNLAPDIVAKGGGEVVDPTTGVKTIFTKQGDAFKKQYAQPDTFEDITIGNYEPTTPEALKMKKGYVDLDKINAQIGQIKENTRLMQPKFEQKEREIRQKVKSDAFAQQYKMGLLKLREASNAIRISGLQLAHADRQQAMGISAGRLGLASQGFQYRIAQDAQGRLAGAKQELQKLKASYAQHVDKREKNQKAAAQAAISEMEGYVKQLETTANGFAQPFGMSNFLANEGIRLEDDSMIDSMGMGGFGGMGGYGGMGGFGGGVPAGYNTGGQSPNVNIVIPPAMMGGGGQPGVPGNYAQPAQAAPPASTQAGSAVFRTADGSAIPVGGPNGLRVGSQPNQVNNKAKAMAAILGKK
jgi:hypothetical protein